MNTSVLICSTIRSAFIFSGGTVLGGVEQGLALKLPGLQRNYQRHLTNPPLPPPTSILMTTTAFNLPSPPTSPTPSLSKPPSVLTVMLTTGKCDAKRCFCQEGRFAASNGNPATLECENCQHSFTHHTLHSSTLSAPVVPRPPMIPLCE